MSAIKVPAIFTAIDKFSNPVKRMTKSTQTFAQKAEVGIARLDRRMRKLTPSIGAMGKQMLGLAATGAIVAGVGSAIRTIKDFEQANADLSAVMSSATAPQLKSLSKDAARLGGITSKTATEVVGLQESFARLGFETPDIVNMTEATIAGSVAMNAELAETAELTGAMIRTFDKLESTDATQVIDQMTLATQKSALNFVKLQTALPIVAGASQAAGISFERTVALLGKLSDSGIDASSSATALRNIFLESAKQGLSYEQILEKIEKNQNKLTAANDQFGKRAAVSASILSKNIRETGELTKVLELAKKGLENSGAAADAAAKRQDTLGGSLTLLSSKWDSILLKQDENTGSVGKMNTAVKFLTENLETITGGLVIVAAAFVTMKLALFGAKAALFLYNVGLGITGALSGTASVAIGANSTALIAYNLASKAAAAGTYIMTAAQWALNAALAVNPIIWIVAAVVALLALIVLAVVYWDEWTTALMKWLTQFEFIVNIFKWFEDAWSRIKKGFQDGGIVGALKEIGKSLLSYLIAPIEYAFKLLGSIPGVGMGLGIGDKISEIRAKIEGVTPDAAPKDEDVVPAINTKAIEQEALKETIENNNNTNATLTVLAPKGSTQLEQDDNFFPKITTSLLSAFN